MYTLIDEDHKDRAELNIFGVVNRIAKQHVGETEDYVSDSVGDAQLWESALRRNSQNFLRNNQIQKALKKLGHLCNNRCVFCSSGQLTAMKLARPVPLEPIVEALEEARAAGATHCFTLRKDPHASTEKQIPDYRCCERHWRRHGAQVRR